MSLTIMKIMLVLGIIGHALNMYCDRILSVFPNGTLKLEDIKTFGKDDKMATLMEGVSEKIPMRSAILGAFALMLDLFNSAPITRVCYVGYLVFIFTLIIAIVSGTAALPLWSAIFTILPVFIILFPFRIIGTLHISAMVSMLVWILLII